MIIVGILGDTKNRNLVEFDEVEKAAEYIETVEKENEGKNILIIPVVCTEPIGYVVIQDTVEPRGCYKAATLEDTIELMKAKSGTYVFDLENKKILTKEEISQ